MAAPRKAAEAAVWAFKPPLGVAIGLHTTHLALQGPMHACLLSSQDLGVYPPVKQQSSHNRLSLPAGAAAVLERGGSARLPGGPRQHGAEPAQPGGGQPPDRRPGPAPGLHQPVHRRLHRLLRQGRGQPAPCHASMRSAGVPQLSLCFPAWCEGLLCYGTLAWHAVLCTRHLTAYLVFVLCSDVMEGRGW